jgi:hypothetical protein
MIVVVFGRWCERGSCVVVSTRSTDDNDSLPIYSRSLNAVRGCDTWFSRASSLSLSDLLVLPGILSLMRLGILSLILDRHPLPPPLLLLLLPLSLPPPGCQPPFAILRRLDMVFCMNCLAASQLCHIPLMLVLHHRMPRLRQPSCSSTLTSCLYHHTIEYIQSGQGDMSVQSILSYAIRQWGISLIDKANSRTPLYLSSVWPSCFLLANHTHLPQRW